MLTAQLPLKAGSIMGRTIGLMLGLPGLTGKCGISRSGEVMIWLSSVRKALMMDDEIVDGSTVTDRLEFVE
jgi:hypothetical protein